MTEFFMAMEPPTITHQEHKVTIVNGRPVFYDPPEVDDNYMANLKQQARVDRLKQQWDKLSLKKTKFVDDGQLEFG